MLFTHGRLAVPGGAGAWSGPSRPPNGWTSWFGPPTTALRDYRPAMNDLGFSPDKPEADDVPRWMIVVVAALLVSLVAVGVVLVTHGPTPTQKPANASATAAAVVHPKRWDRRIAPYVK